MDQCPRDKRRKRTKSTKSVTVMRDAILTLYPHAQTLFEFLCGIPCIDRSKLSPDFRWDDKKKSRIMTWPLVGEWEERNKKHGHIQDYFNLLHHSLFLLEPSTKKITIPKDCEQRSSLKQVLGDAVRWGCLLQQQSKNQTSNLQPNILIIGARVRADQMTYTLPNTIHNEFYTFAWETLLSLIGDDTFILILIYGKLFRMINDRSYIQLTGIPVTSNIPYPYPYVKNYHKTLKSENQLHSTPKKSSKETESVDPPEKKMRLETHNNNQDSNKTFLQKIAPLQIEEVKDSAIARYRLLYQGRRGPRRAFPPKHPLNSNAPTRKGAKNLAQVIFQSCFGKRHQCFDKRFPDRLRGSLKILRAILKRHNPKRYSRIFNYICHSKEGVCSSNDNDLDFRDATEERFSTSHPIDMSDSRKTHQTPTDDYEKLVNQDTDEYEVVRFAHAVVRCLLPFSSLGSTHNWTVFRSNVRDVITLCKSEKITSSYYMKSMKVNDVPWLQNPKAKGRSSPSDHALKVKLLEKFLEFIFEKFVIQLISAYFYCTETASSRNKIHYYRYNIWAKIDQIMFAHLSERLLRPANMKEVAESAEKGSTVPLQNNFRLLPKASSARPIINLKGSKDASTNRSIYDVFSVVRHELSQQKEVLGSSLLGMDDIYKAIHNFLSHQFKITENVYFVALDVKGAYDHIPHSVLTNTIQNIFSKDQYIIQKLKELSIFDGRVKVKSHRKVYPFGRYPLFSEVAKSISAHRPPGRVFVDSVSYSIVDRPSLKQRLQAHVSRNIVKYRSKYFIQKVGIPQGSVLSTLLCSYFLADHERTHIDERLKSDGSLLVRYIDDSLYMSTSKENCLEFVKIMSEAHVSHSITINCSKTVSNFEIDGHPDSTKSIVKRNGLTLFPWCGLLIETSTGQVFADYERYANTDVRNSLSVEFIQHPGLYLRSRLMRFMLPKIHPIFVDEKFNSHETACYNVFEAFTMTSMKFCAYVKQLSRKCHMREAYLLRE
eukprot:TRINITY_DN2642_c0_g1_i7.p1 TRINITY_DN2642_c0_g1~~TRINITY_DN2642_c0_g1_i7.p1  ORF type:complete len:995 (-),score=114.28 TRINITY_DN2642_c0_g1_i7:1204-4188(-)